MTVNIQSHGEVNICHFNPESDAKEVANIWVSGLEQTVATKSRLTQPIWKMFFDHMAEKAVGPDGDVGPNGQNLSRHWCEDAKNRSMLVARMMVDDRNAPRSRIVGCIAVIRGTRCGANTEVESTESTFSVWKMSVTEEFRRKGIGAKLLEAGEMWAKNNGCTKMRMITANPIASRFYQNQGYKLLASRLWGTLFGAWHEKDL